MPFTLVLTGKYRTEDKSKTDTAKTKDNLAEKANNSLVSGLVASYDTRPGNEVGLIFYNAPDPTQGRKEGRKEVGNL